MKYAIVVSHNEGNTKLLADVIKETLNENDCIYYGVMNDEVKNADIIYVGFWTDKGTCDIVTQDYIKSLKNKNIFLFGSCGFGKDPSYFDRILDRTKANLDSSVVVVGSYMCQGRMKNSVRERYVQMKKANPNMPNIDMLIENFDEALSHPNEDDFNNLRHSVLNSINV